MGRHGKKFKEAVGKVPEEPQALPAAIGAVRAAAFAKFDETMELSVRLGVNPKHADQMVRGTVVLPHGTGKSVQRVVGLRRRRQGRRRPRKRAPTTSAART